MRFFVKVSDKVELVFALGASRIGSVGICCCLVERVDCVQGEVLVFHCCWGGCMRGRWS